VDADHARALALALPEATEQDHHGKPSFRVRGKIFATLWTTDAMNVMVGEQRIRSAVADAPEVCSPVTWGSRLAAVQVRLAVANPVMVESLLAEAWAHKAPASLAE
jgi:hypothetical protein